MQHSIKNFFLIWVVAAVFSACSSPTSEGTEADIGTEQERDPLPSWNETATKQAILDFVKATTEEGGAGFVPTKDRIATFDNDGNLWAEQPLYFQLAFAIDRIKAMAPDHPEWEQQQPYKAVLEGDMETILAGGEHALLEIVMATHADITTEEFQEVVKDWLATSTHPTTGKHYHEMIYQPMVELLEYLRANDYTTFIVSGGGVDFMRAWVEEAYGIPPHQVVGSSGKVKYELVDGKPELIKLPELNFIDDKEGKPVGIHQYIGQRPVLASGNSDGDYQMLHWTTSGTGYPRLGLLLNHTDAEREWAYDRESHIGRLNKGLDDAEERGWVVIDMKKDWKVIYSWE